MTHSNNELPHEKPFVESTPSPNGNRNSDSENGALRVVMLLISLVSLTIALVSGAVVVFQILTADPDLGAAKYEGILGKLFIIGLVYAIGWLVALIGIRVYHNLVLPIFINAYGWLTLCGVAALYILIINKLFQQSYSNESFIKYSVIMGGAIIALIGLHLLVEEHSLVYFSIPLLIINLAHLCVIVYHYIFMTAKSEYLLGDIVFFGGMGTVSVLMLMHLGVLSAPRKFIDNLFAKTT
mgnify:CR=1 FL=1